LRRGHAIEQGVKNVVRTPALDFQLGRYEDTVAEHGRCVLLDIVRRSEGPAGKNGGRSRGAKEGDRRTR
jgi:hypothetical protein